MPNNPTPNTDSVDAELRTEIEKRVHIAMIHARNTKDAPSIQPMLIDTVNIIVEAAEQLLTQARKGYVPGSEAEAYKALVRKQLTKLEAGVFAVQLYLNSPYPDDERWTPYTRFIQPRLEMLRVAIVDGKEIGEKAAMAHPDQDPPQSKLYTQAEVDQKVNAEVERRLKERG